MKSLGSPVHPELNNPEVHWSEKIVRRDFPNTQPAKSLTLTSEHAQIEVQVFADAFGIPAEQVLNQAVLFWFDMHGAQSILNEEQKQERRRKAS
jgi:hypothetical protein